MGDWIKENKFEAGLLLVVLLLVIGAFVLGSGQGKKYQEHKDYYDAAAISKKTLESKRPFPSRENQAEYAEQVADYDKVIDGLESALLKYRPAKFESITPPEFTDKLNAAISSATSAFQGKVKFPEDKWRLGFERYTESPPTEDATAYLSFQLDALSWLYGALAESGASELLNVHRPELPVEKGESMGGSDDSKGGSRRSRGSKASSGGDPFHVLPLELTFKAPELAVRDFLGKVASNPDYFFVIRSLRIQNEKRDKGPQRDDVEFKDVAGDDTFGDTFDIIPVDEPPAGDEPLPDDPGDAPLFPEEDEPEIIPEAASGERILGQVLGAEELYVFLEIELILFTEGDEEESDEEESDQP